MFMKLSAINENGSVQPVVVNLQQVDTIWRSDIENAVEMIFTNGSRISVIGNLDQYATIDGSCKEITHAPTHPLVFS